MIAVSVQAEPFDLGALIAAAEPHGGGIGAVATFTGYVRDEAGRLDALELEHFPGMAEAQLGAIAAEATKRWRVSHLAIVHRHGRLAPGEPIVAVVAASAHRDAAFDAARFVMDYLKTDAPFWKKEHPKTGSAAWVEPKAADDRAKDRWKG